LRYDDEHSEGFLFERNSPAKIDIIRVDKEILKKFGASQEIINKGAVTITFTGQKLRQDKQGGEPRYFFGVNDKLIREIIIANKFERPVYFINSAGEDALCGLGRYLRMEGLCSRVYPVPQTMNENETAYNEEIMNAVLLNIDNTDNISKTHKYGLKLRNLNNPKIVYDETDRRQI
jgi:hypothetical protein